MSGEWTPNQQIPTENELAEAYSVSVITIKSALKLLVNDNLIERIAGKGSFVKAPKHSQRIGLIMNGISASYGVAFLLNLEHELALKDYTLTIHFSEEDAALEEAYLKEFYEENYGGIIIFPVQNKYHNPFLVELILKDYPVIILDRNLEYIDSYFVGGNNYAAAKKMTELIIAKGHQQVSIVSHKMAQNLVISQRKQGIIKAFNDHNLAHNSEMDMDFLSSNFVFSGQLSGGAAEIEADISNVMAFIQAHSAITCFFCLNYDAAEVVYKSLKQLGKKVPEEYSIVCFDMIDSLFNSEHFAFVKQNEPLIAKKVSQMLTQVIEGKTVIEKKEYVDLIIKNEDNIKEY